MAAGLRCGAASRSAWAEVEDVGHDHRVQSSSLLELRSGQAVDAHVPDGRQVRGKGRLEDVGNDASCEPLSFPPVVVMVADGGQSELVDQAAERHAKGQLHRDRPRVLDDEGVQLVDAKNEYRTTGYFKKGTAVERIIDAIPNYGSGPPRDAFPCSPPGISSPPTSRWAPRARTPTWPA